MFTFIRTAIDYVVAKVVAAYQAVVNFFFAKEEKKETTSTTSTETKTTERATAFFVLVEEGKNTPEATAKAFADMVYGCHNEKTLDEAFDDYIELAKSKVAEDKEVNAYLLDVLKMEERVFIALKNICGKDVSAYYSLFALYEVK